MRGLMPRRGVIPFLDLYFDTSIHDASFFSSGSHTTGIDRGNTLLYLQGQ